jgi:hypothetical protein
LDLRGFQERKFSVMGAFQKFIIAVVPKSWAQALEAESRKWMMQCPCGAETSIWDLGGVRYKAVGEPRHWRRCAKCGKRTWHRLYYRGIPAKPLEPETDAMNALAESEQGLKSSTDRVEP